MQILNIFAFSDCLCNWAIYKTEIIIICVGQGKWTKINILIIILTVLGYSIWIDFGKKSVFIYLSFIWGSSAHKVHTFTYTFIHGDTYADKNKHTQKNYLG